MLKCRVIELLGSQAKSLERRKRVTWAEMENHQIGIICGKKRKSYDGEHIEDNIRPSYGGIGGGTVTFSISGYRDHQMTYFVGTTLMNVATIVRETLRQGWTALVDKGEEATLVEVTPALEPTTQSSRGATSIYHVKKRMTSNRRPPPK